MARALDGGRPLEWLDAELGRMAEEGRCSDGFSRPCRLSLLIRYGGFDLEEG